MQRYSVIAKCVVNKEQRFLKYRNVTNLHKLYDWIERNIGRIVFFSIYRKGERDILAVWSKCNGRSL